MTTIIDTKPEAERELSLPKAEMTLQYPLRPRAKGVFPKKSALMPPSSRLGLYALGAAFPSVF